MDKPRIALISTGIGVVPTISNIVNELNPNIDIINIVDDSVIKTIAANDNIIPASVYRRLASYFIYAEEMGAIGAILTCSSVSEIVNVASQLVEIPCFKIDQPMADKALDMGETICVAATLKTTLEPTKRLIRSRAMDKSKDVRIEGYLCENAFDEWQNGNVNKANELVAEAIKALANENDVIVLAQASMAGAIKEIPDSIKNKVLTSPLLGIMAALTELGLIL